MKVWIVRLPGTTVSASRLNDATQPFWMGLAEDPITAAKYALARGAFDSRVLELAIYDQDGNPAIPVNATEWLTAA